MASLTADKLIGKTLYAKSNVDLYNYPGGKVIKTIPAGNKLGIVDSYNVYEGNVYWQFLDAYNKTYYAKQGTNIDFPGYSDLLQQVADQQKAQEIEKKGILQYYLDNYLPYIVGAIALAILLPTIIKSTKK
jgi:hypothetical protein